MQPSRTTTFFKVRRSTALPWGKTGTSVQRVATLRRTSIWATSQAVSRILLLLFCPLCSRQTTPLSHPGLPVGGQWPFCVVFYYVLPLYFVPHRTCARQSHMFCAPWTSPDLSSVKSAWRPSPQQEEWRQLCPATVKFRDALQQEATATVLWWPVLPAGWLLLLFGTLLILCQITLSSYKYKINFFFFLIYAGQLQNNIPGQSIKIVNSRKQNFAVRVIGLWCVFMCTCMYCSFQIALVCLLLSYVLCRELITPFVWFVDFKIFF